VICTLAGAVSAAKSFAGPASDHRIWVVVRQSGSRVRRASGIDKIAPTVAVPVASNAPRNDRRVSPGRAELKVTSGTVAYFFFSVTR
jgi:hypothetical protein